MKHIKKET